MPKQYEDIKNSYLKSGKSMKDAKSIAAATFIKNGKGAGGRSGRAKSLHADSKSIPMPPKKVGKGYMPSDKDGDEK
jgi:hypothetical protein